MAASQIDKMATPRETPVSPNATREQRIEQQWPPHSVTGHYRIDISPATLISLVLVIASIWLVAQLWPVVLVVIVALLVAATLGPAVRWLEERQVRRGVGIALVFTLYVILVVLFVAFTVPALMTQAAALMENELGMRIQLATYLESFPLTAPLSLWIRELKLDSLVGYIGATALNISMRFTETVAYGLSALFLGLYIVIDRDRLRGGLFSLVPRAGHLRLSRVMMNLETIVVAYIRGQIITCLLMAIFTYVLLRLSGVDNALALGAFAGLVDILPYIGPLLVVVPAVLSALPNGTVVGIVVLVFLLAYGEVESRVLVPRIYGRALRLPSSIVMVALLAGGTLMGILGAILSLPVAATMVMLLEELRVELPGEQPQSTDALQSEADERGEEEYARRAAGLDVAESAAIAAEISSDRRAEDDRVVHATESV